MKTKRANPLKNLSDIISIMKISSFSNLRGSISYVCHYKRKNKRIYNPSYYCNCFHNHKYVTANTAFYRRTISIISIKNYELIKCVISIQQFGASCKSIKNKNKRNSLI